MIVYNINSHVAGDTWIGIPQITIQRNGSAVDLTNALLEMQVRASIDSPIVLELNQNNGITILSPASAGNLRLNSQIIDIPVGNYIYDLKITLNTGEVKTEMGGNWPIISHVSR